MRIGLVAPVDVAPDVNPGSHMITAGIRYLLRQAVPDARFVPIELLTPWGDAERKAAASCDVLVLSGNPRFDTGADQWLYAGVLDEMLASGRPVLDLWAGSCTPLGLSESDQLAQLVANERNRGIAERLSRCAALVMRDPMALQVSAAMGLQARLLPCSSWWAAAEYGIERVGGDRRILIPYRHQDVGQVKRLAAGRQVVTVAQADHDWFARAGVKSQLIFDPEALLSLFAESEEVISFRLHSAIPAASLGCRVLMVAIDTRAAAVDLFGLPRSPLTAEVMPNAELAVAPAPPISYLENLINA